MTVPWTMPESGTWRSGMGAGPFTVDSGGGYDYGSDYVGSLPVQPHPAFAQAHHARHSTGTARLAYQDEAPLHSPAISDSSSYAYPSRSARSSRQNSISGSSAFTFTPASSLSSANAGKPYARPSHQSKAKSTDRTSMVPGSLWAHPSVAKKPPTSFPPATPIASTSHATSNPPQPSPVEPIDSRASFRFQDVEDEVGPATSTVRATRATSVARDVLSTAPFAPLSKSKASPARSGSAEVATDDETAEELEANDPLATSMWKFFARAKKQAMPHASRMENLAWRVGGLKLAAVKAEKEQTPEPFASSSAAQADTEERGRKGRSIEPIVEQDTDEMDWRAKSRSRSRAAERFFEPMDWRAASRSRSRARPPIAGPSFDAFRQPGSPAPPVLSNSHNELFNLDAILAQAAAEADSSSSDVNGLPAMPDVMAMPIMDDAVSRMFGFEAYNPTLASAPRPSNLSSSSSSVLTAQPSMGASTSKRDRALSPHRTYDDAMRRRALGSVPGIVGEASLPVNQDATYGFLPRLVRKTSFDAGSSSSAARATPAYAQPATSSVEYPFADPSAWARVLDPRGDVHDLYGTGQAVRAPAAAPQPKAPLSYSMPPASTSHDLSYPYAFRLVNNKHQLPNASPASVAPFGFAASASTSGIRLVDPPSPFRPTSQAIDSTAWSALSTIPPAAILSSQQQLPTSSYVNPALMLKSAPPTAAPSPTSTTVYTSIPNGNSGAARETVGAGGATTATETAVSPSWSLSTNGWSHPASPEEMAAQYHQAVAAQQAQLQQQRDHGALERSGGSTSTSTSTAMGDGPATVCTNCKTTNTPLWRRDEAGRPLCNGCGLFRKLHGVDRPLHLATGVVKKRNRNRAKDAPKKTTSSNRAARRSSTA